MICSLFTNGFEAAGFFVSNTKYGNISFSRTKGVISLLKQALAGRVNQQIVVTASITAETAIIYDG